MQLGLWVWIKAAQPKSNKVDLLREKSEQKTIET